MAADISSDAAKARVRREERKVSDPELLEAVMASAG